QELQRLNLLTSQFLDYAEFQALEQNPMRMEDWITALDEQILRLRRNILEGNGGISHKEAIEKAEHEFEIYREREMRILESDFDKAIKGLIDNNSMNF
ncbi:MAG: RhuM family protein, partial [Candidatus Cryptobacteroides sp.]|nr:RhuM family protein [Candidatus Cryptobacteroides sp.]